MGKLRVSDSEALVLVQSLRHVPPPPLDIRRCSEGGEHLVWTVNDALVLRVPADQGSGGEPLLRERRLLDLLRRNDKLAPLVPLCIDVGVWNPHGRQYALYHKAKGVSVESDPRGVTRGTEDDLVAFLVGLAGVRVGDALGIGVPEGEEVDLDEVRGRATAALDVLRRRQQLMELDEVISLAKLDAPGHVQPGSSVRRVLTHADLKGEHVFLDAAGRVTGVIDWSDARVGCPSIEVSGLAVAVGARMAARVAKRAGYEADIVCKGVIMARCNGVLCLEAILRGDDDSPELLVRRQLRRAFEEFDA
ncbi:aminoglycoside 3'-phosphotransferase/choline kinase domain protein [Metarhizium robertsii]|uniref:Aminoglycoside phosphotransferase n=2 Tax=Metarhizium robertsii TaxID=568076 RepID=E9EXY5_METRA|nr:Aminoglycoside phosphotransferase [Metarhizium robertsii ARSEF 23]EFY99955.1 Aminoglycoside phosphotransferase [Metarhizium robertsii ARSEF 23]EXV06653.1 aminoglycoside 3'-phosphotransferase/choline kinase domain protein [Metarhizium robertsii]